jgi:hypothetical protein
MLNRKIFVKSTNSKYIGVEQSFLAIQLREFVGTILVDQEWYLKTNPDVTEAIESGLYNDAKEHYCLHGYYEHRMPYFIEVNESWYIGEYADIRKAVQAGAYPTGQAHFEELGYKEGRFPFPNFSLKQVHA